MSQALKETYLEAAFLLLKHCCVTKARTLPHVIQLTQHSLCPAQFLISFFVENALKSMMLHAVFLHGRLNECCGEEFSVCLCHQIFYLQYH